MCCELMYTCVCVCCVVLLLFVCVGPISRMYLYTHKLARILFSLTDQTEERLMDEPLLIEAVIRKLSDIFKVYKNDTLTRITKYKYRRHNISYTRQRLYRNVMMMFSVDCVVC